ncbi:MAG: hypothetical protein M3209_03295 [Acidobacteriota bacterium]|nr:hypothetical protein [Acidobacteriota bacterium]
MLGLSEEERLAKMTRVINERNEELNNKSGGVLKHVVGSANAVKANAERLFKQQTAMMIVARASGGFTESLDPPERADAVYSRILNDTNNRYLIGYYPKNQERDGRRRTIKIEVRGHPEYIVWGRKTYIAPLSKK